MSAAAVIGTRTKKRRGRPLAAGTLAIREAILGLTEIHERMTVRGIFYALEGRGIVPKDDTRGYRPVQRQVLALRREGLLPWAFVADGTRWMRRVDTFDDVEDALTQTARLYRRDLWRSQGHRVEVWLEKDALADLLWPIAEKWGVPLAVSRGVPSATYVYNAAMDALHAARTMSPRRTRVLCLYDYDAGGERAFRTVDGAFNEYVAPYVQGSFAPAVERVALLEHQVEAWNLPTRPPKRTDPEAAKWGGRPCVELDAIPPNRLLTLVEDAVVGLVDPHAWQIAQAAEREERDVLRRVVEGMQS